VAAAQNTCPPPGSTAHAAGTLPLSGIVGDSRGAPLVGARLTLAGSDRTLFTADDGVFDFGFLPAGNYRLVVRRVGYQETTIDLRLAEPAPACVLVRLAAVPVQLSEVVARAPLSDFERTTGFSERRRRGHGAFFDRADIEKRKPQKLTDLLRSVPGFRVETHLTRWGYQTTPTMDRAAASMIGCPMEFYVNGHEYTPTSMGIDNDVPANQIEAVEVYTPSQNPPRFLGGRSRCGTVVIWTRYRAHELER
jgi:hypothetical protein